MSGTATESGQPRAKSGEVRCMHIVSIYTYHIDTQSFLRFNAKVKTAAHFPARYCHLQRQLTRMGYLSQGSVFKRAPGQQGSRYVWTRKVKAKTVTVALSEEQFRWLRQAVDNQ